MKPFLFVIYIFLSAFSTVSAQDVSVEIAGLRTFLKIPDRISIEVGKDSEFPTSRPTKVYLATGLDLGVRTNFENWFAEWNKKEGPKRGTITIVDDLITADVVVARYRKTDQVETLTQTKSIVIPGTVWDPVKNTTVTAPVVRNVQGSAAMVPVYGYILVKYPDRLAILRRYSDLATLTETKHSGEDLRDMLYKLLKSSR